MAQRNESSGVCGVDTRQLTKKIRNEGNLKCVISTEGISFGEAKELCRNGVIRGDWMKEVSIDKKATMESLVKSDEEPMNVAVLDFGIKADILTCLRERNCNLTIYPYGTKAEEILADKPDGIFLTNGPGNPEEATEAIEEVKKIIGTSDIPMFGVGMGHQIIAIALGGKTYKLKYGHRGSNHGVFDKDTKRSYITSQNHGYAVQYESIILKGMEITHLNLNDGTVEGIEHRDLPIFSVQFNPETSLNANDTGYLFDKFLKMMKEDVINA